VPKKKPIWGAFVNLNGLYSQRPIRGYWHVTHRCWWTKDGNLEFTQLGITRTKNWPGTAFASYNKKDVEMFIEGAKAMQRILKNLLPSK